QTFSVIPRSWILWEFFGFPKENCQQLKRRTLFSLVRLPSSCHHSICLCTRAKPRVRLGSSQVSLCHNRRILHGREVLRRRAIRIQPLSGRERGRGPGTIWHLV